jgi:hypothetical protein
MAEGIPPLVGINVHLALQRRNAALANMDSENAALKQSNFNLDAAGHPYWDRNVWEGYKAQFGRYPFGPDQKPANVMEAPAWVKQICGIGLTPAERMGGGSR